MDTDLKTSSVATAWGVVTMYQPTFALHLDESVAKRSSRASFSATGQLHALGL